MEARQFKPYFIIIGLMALTSMVLAFTVDVAMVNEAGIKVTLPNQIDQWVGREILYCQNPEHQRTYLAEDLEDRSTCPDCGAELYMMSVDERRVLPADTVILKRQYQHPSGDGVLASIVLSGADRSSIHRPQLCLTGQGQTIIREWPHQVELPGREPLNVMVLDMVRRWTDLDGQPREYNFYYAYWFVGQDRETHSHYQRMFWMGWDRIIHNVAHRWAYVAVSGSREGDYTSEIDYFLQNIYPPMIL